MSGLTPLGHNGNIFQKFVILILATMRHRDEILSPIWYLMFITINVSHGVTSNRGHIQIRLKVTSKLSLG